MSYRNPNTSQGSDDLHGLKESISEADFSAELADEKKDKRKENKFEKKFFLKKESKEKGYASLAGAFSNQDAVFLVNTKNAKKPKVDTKIASLSVFKKSFKDEKRLKDIKEAKEESKRNKKLKERSANFHGREHGESFFGNHLENVVRAFPSNDGVKVPAPIRISIDLIEQKEHIECDHLYRRSVNKSQLESICDAINGNKFETRLDELNADPNLACQIIKKFLRELKAPLINDEVLSTLEKCDSNISDKETKVEFLKRQLARIPQPNLDTFTYLLMHFHRVLQKSDLNKIEIGIFIQKFHPMLRIKERLFKFMINYADLLFSEFRYKKYRIKVIDESISRFSLLPDNIEDLEQEISKQEIYLSKLHSRIANEENSNDKTIQEQLCDELWALQRYVTSLKRKVKKLKLERKTIETEQINKLKEIQSQTSQSKEETKIKQTSPSDDVVNDAVQINESTIDHAEKPLTLSLNPTELINEELNLICENTVLIESVQKLFEKANQEKQFINELQQKLATTSNLNLAFMPDTSKLTAQELHDSEQLILNENKLLEERINLINKRINVEKEKIFELKLSLQLKTMQVLTSEQLVLLSNNQLDLHLIGQINLPDKELIMTKL